MATSTNPGLSDAEKAAARERVKELKAEQKRGEDREAGLKDLQAKIAEMEPGDRQIAQQIYDLVTNAAPGLDPKTWYGMPAWVNGSGKLVCWFKPSAKFKDRYCSFGFEQAAILDGLRAVLPDVPVASEEAACQWQGNAPGEFVLVDPLD